MTLRESQETLDQSNMVEDTKAIKPATVQRSSFSIRRFLPQHKTRTSTPDKHHVNESAVQVGMMMMGKGVGIRMGSASGVEKMDGVENNDKRKQHNENCSHPGQGSTTGMSSPSLSPPTAAKNFSKPLGPCHHAKAMHTFRHSDQNGQFACAEHHSEDYCPASAPAWGTAGGKVSENAYPYWWRENEGAPRLSASPPSVHPDGWNGPVQQLQNQSICLSSLFGSPGLSRPGQSVFSNDGCGSPFLCSSASATTPMTASGDASSASSATSLSNDPSTKDACPLSAVSGHSSEFGFAWASPFDVEAELEKKDDQNKNSSSIASNFYFRDSLVATTSNDTTIISESTPSIQAQQPQVPSRPSLEHRESEQRPRRSSKTTTSRRLPQSAYARAASTTRVTKGKRDRKWLNSRAMQGGVGKAGPRPGLRWPMPDNARDLFLYSGQLSKHVDAEELLSVARLEDIQQSSGQMKAKPTLTLTQQDRTSGREVEDDMMDETPVDPFHFDDLPLRIGASGIRLSADLPLSPPPPPPPPKVAKTPTTGEGAGLADRRPSTPPNSNLPGLPPVKKRGRHTHKKKKIKSKPLPIIPEFGVKGGAGTEKPVPEMGWDAMNPPAYSKDYLYFPCTPYSLVAPGFRHGPIRLCKIDLAARPKLVREEAETLDWTAFQMAILDGASDKTDEDDDLRYSLEEAEEEIDDLVEWYEEFGFTGYDVVVTEEMYLAELAERESYEARVARQEALVQMREKQQAGARHKRGKSSNGSLGNWPFPQTKEGVLGLVAASDGEKEKEEEKEEKEEEKEEEEEEEEEEGQEQQQDEPPKQQDQANNGGADADLGGEKAMKEEEKQPQPQPQPPPPPQEEEEEEVVQMGATLGSDLGDFLMWSSQHVSAVGFYSGEGSHGDTFA